MTISNTVLLAEAGPTFSRFVQGYWRLANWEMKLQQRLAFIQEHVDLGITTVDHASIYGSPSCETLFGEALKLQPALRDKLQIVTKCGIELANNSNKQTGHYLSDHDSIVASVDLSLRRLGVEWIDVLLMHRPDRLMNADQVADTFETLKQSGKVKYFGVSNFSVSQFSLLQSRLNFPLVTNQIEINPCHLGPIEDGSLDFLQQEKVFPMAWSCLAGGQIFNRSFPQHERLRAELEEIKKEMSAASIDQVIFAWIMRLPAEPLPILGSGNIQRINSALGALKLSMNAEQWYRVWAASTGHAVP